jgi:HTH-type transcriptional regulator/antitoxin HigA
MATTRLIPLDTLSSAVAIHPGEILADELEFAGISQLELAKLIDEHKSVISEVVNGKRRLSADLAVKLEAALDLTAEHWNNLQAAYDLDLARMQQRGNTQLAAAAIIRDLRIFVPISELRKRGVLIDDAVADVTRLFSLYQVDNPQELKALVESKRDAFALFRRSEKLQTDPVKLTAWVMLAHEAARRQVAAAFVVGIDPQPLLADIHQILVRNQNVIPTLQERLATAGIKLAIVTHLPQTPVDGMAWWCEESKCPAIALTLRHHRLDNLIFTLFHELGHIFLHLQKRDGPCEYLDLEQEEDGLPQAELEANAWATKQLVPEALLEQFLTSKQRMQEQYLFEIAREARVNPVILLGQRCHALRDFAPLKRASYNQIN